MNRNLKIGLVLAGTAAVVYLAYKKLPRLINPPKTGCDDNKNCTGYPCKVIDDYFDIKFPPQTNLDDNGKPIYNNECRYKRYRENPDYLTAWADALLAKQPTFDVDVAVGEDIKKGKYCTTTGNLVTDPNSGSNDGVCPDVKY